MPTPQPVPIPLPPAVRRLLRRLAGRARLAALLRLVAVASLSLETACLALYILDRYGDTPFWVRLVLFEGALLTGLGAAVAGLRAVNRWDSLAACARLVMRSDPRLGHLLLSAVELAAAPAPDESSRPLLQAAVGQVAEACAGWEPRRLVRWLPGPRLAAALALCTAAMLPAAAGSPHALANAFRRLTAPLAPVPRLTRVVLADVMPERPVPRGEPSRVSVRVRARRGPLPATLRWRLDNGLRGRRPVPSSGLCQVTLPALDQPATLSVSCGDARVQSRLKPAPRPELVRLVASVDGDTQGGGTRVTLVPGSLQVSLPVGATLRLEGDADRPLADVRVWLAQDRPLTRLCTSPSRFVADLGPIAASTEVRLAWQARDGLWGNGPLRLQVQALPDRAPVLTWTAGAPPATAPVNSLLTVCVTAEDDWALRHVDLRAGGTPGPRLQRSLAAGAASRHAELALTLCPADLGLLPGQSVWVEALAADATPGREPARLTAVIVLVGESTQSAGLAQRARLAWQRLEQVAADEARQAETERTGAAAPATLPTPAAEILNAGVRSAEASARALRDLGAELGRMVEGAEAISGFDTEVTAAWSDAQRTLETLVGEAFPALLAALRQPWSGSTTPAARLAAVWPRRLDIVAALRAVLAAEDSFRRGAARTAALRLQEAARAEQAMAAALADLPDRWAGLALEQLDAPACERLSDLGRRQEQVGHEVASLAALLRDLASSGAPEAYGRVADALDGSALLTDLQHAAAQIRRNHRFFALSTAEEAATALAAWADDLMAGTANETGSRGNGQGAAPGGSADVARRLRRLLVAQEALRERTSAAAAVTSPDLLRQGMASRLATHQGRLAADLPDLSRVGPTPLTRLLDQAGRAMSAATEHLVVARLDPAQAAQAAASEWLLACLQSVRSGATADAGGSGAATTAAAGGAGLGQTGNRGPAEAPLTSAPGSDPRAPAWTGLQAPRAETLLRAVTPTDVPAPYRALWERYRQRLEESAP